MNAKRENKILTEIRRRAFARSDAFRQEYAGAQAVNNTLDALEEVTDLPRMVLENIARDVRYGFKAYDRGFFSIKNQIAFAGASFGIVIILIGLLIAWII